MKTLKSVLLAIPLLIAACDVPDYGSTPVSKSYIQEFLTASSMSAATTSVDGVIKLSFDGALVFDNTSEEFIELRNRFGDNHYNQPMVPGSTRAISNEFTGLEVTSDAEFNGIPAGESLLPVAEPITASAYQYIRNGYVGLYLWHFYAPDIFKEGGLDDLNHYCLAGFYPIVRTASKVVPENLLLMDYNVVYLKFAETPSLKEHNLSITFREAGRALTALTSISF